ncbi:MAG TPA: PH domain-containing protein [Gemmatimonadaceae bacterium]|nr:PH domain-containing protein [Gemmatimonadaceae bacterium]
MLKRFAAEALGLSDIGIIVPPSDYDKVDSDDYLFHEDGERIFFLIKSKKDEYCFTNLALIHVDGDSAVSAKRSIKRYEYASYLIDDVAIETAGTVDLDVELKFTVGGARLSIDVRKNFLEQLKDIYKALHTIGKLQRLDQQAREHALHCLGQMGGMFKLNDAPTPDAPVRVFEALLAGVNEAVQVRHTRRDFSTVFEKYIHA